MGRPAPHERIGIRRAFIPIAGVVVLLLVSTALASHPHHMPHADPFPAKTVKHWQRVQRWRAHVTPFHCSDAEMTFDGGWYSIPCVNVNAESGGRGGWTCNIYGLIDPTWQQFGGLAYAPTACSASLRDQDRVGAKVWRSVGSAGWTPFE